MNPVCVPRDPAMPVLSGIYRGLLFENTGVRGVLLERPGLLREALKRNEDEFEGREIVRGLDGSALSALERSLTQLQKLNFTDPEPETFSPPALSNYYTAPSRRKTDNVVPCANTITLPSLSNLPIRKDARIVIIRHGKTTHNKLGLFTGWEDAGLLDEGRREATGAGELLRLHGFEFDVCYTSWLSRAIETSYLVLRELDALWVPVISTYKDVEGGAGS
jgi:hypothetical protein